ncbi:MAG TPA: hypothetical protein PKV86_03250 [Syntrophobacteraceae bacterium]|nr:hypothetical protein [Syntrophobacteraceae bacterium]
MVSEQKTMADLLQELLDCTRQLARCEEDDGMDTASLAALCKERLAALQQIASSPGDKDEAFQPLEQVLGRNSRELTDLKSMLQSLVDQTDLCIAALLRRLEFTGQELASLRGSQTAVRAYHRR